MRYAITPGPTHSPARLGSLACVRDRWPWREALIGAGWLGSPKGGRGVMPRPHQPLEGDPMKLIRRIIAATMECGNCGTKWDDWTLPCPNCGRSIT